MKLFIVIGLTAGSLLGGWIGGLFDHGNTFGVWGVLFSTIGAFAGIWAGYKAARNYLG